jgi:putative transcription factor
MSEEWDNVTRIGSKVRAGAAGPKEKVIRGESALNAAKRTGAAIATEKKFGGTNSVSRSKAECPSESQRASAASPSRSRST